MNPLTNLTEEQEKEVLRLWHTGNEAANTIAAEIGIATGQALTVINNARFKAKPNAEQKNENCTIA